jgi:hypothetical protein
MVLAALEMTGEYDFSLPKKHGSGIGPESKFDRF